MRSIDVHLVKSIKQVIDRYLEDQRQEHPLHQPKDIPAGIHGPLAEMTYLDKEDNTTLIDLMIALLYARENRSPEAIVDLLEDLSTALGEMLATPTDEEVAANDA